MLTDVRRVVLAWASATLVALTALRVLVALPEVGAPVTVGALDQAAEEAVGWFARAQQPDGSFIYRVNVVTGAESGGYSWVRHAGVTFALEQAAARDVAGAAAVAERARAALVTQLVDVGPDQMAMRDGGTLTTGGTALAALALDERALRTSSPEDRDRLTRLGAFLASHVAPDGQVPELSALDGSPQPGPPSPFTPGEAAFALARLAANDASLREPVRRILADAAGPRAERDGYVPDTSDHWGAYAMDVASTWREPLTAQEVAWARKQMGLISMQVRFDSQRTPRTEPVRGAPAVGAAAGTLGEALGAWSRLAERVPALSEVRGALAERTRFQAGVLVGRQVTPDEAGRFARPELARGAWLRGDETQIDDQQHTLSALLAAADLERAGGEVPRRNPTPRSGWIVAIAAFAAVNPARVLAARRPASERRPAAVAGFVPAAALTAIAAPALRVLDVSVPTAVIAAGLAVTLGAVVGAGVGPAGPEGRPGRAPWLVPATVPLLARPEVWVLAVAAGAGGRAGWALGGIVVAHGVVAAPGRRGRRNDPVLRWAARLCAAVAVACGVALVVEGVLAV